MPQLYYKYKKYGWQQIPKSSVLPNLTVQIENLLQQVWEAYGILSADDLEELSHQEAPCKKPDMEFKMERLVQMKFHRMIF